MNLLLGSLNYAFFILLWQRWHPGEHLTKLPLMRLLFSQPVLQIYSLGIQNLSICALLLIVVQAVDLAKRFCDGGAPRIINGCLRTYVKDHINSGTSQPAESKEWSFCKYVSQRQLEFIVRKKKASDITEAWRKLALFDQSSSVVLRLMVDLKWGKEVGSWKLEIR
jgi:hypothetical protein